MTTIKDSAFLHYEGTNLVVAGAFEENGQLYDIVIDRAGENLSLLKGKTAPDLAKRIQAIWVKASATRLPKCKLDALRFSYIPQSKTAITEGAGGGFGVSSVVMKELDQELRASVLTPTPPAPVPPKSLEEERLVAIARRARRLYTEFHTNALGGGHASSLFALASPEELRRRDKRQGIIRRIILHGNSLSPTEKAAEKEIAQFIAAVTDSSSSQNEEIRLSAAMLAARMLFSDENYRLYNQKLAAAESQVGSPHK